MNNYSVYNIFVEKNLYSFETTIWYIVFRTLMNRLRKSILQWREGKLGEKYMKKLILVASFLREKQDQLFTLLKKLMSFIHSCLVFFVTKTLSLKHKNFRFGQFSIFWRNNNVSKNLAQFILQWIVFSKC